MQPASKAHLPLIVKVPYLSAKAPSRACRPSTPIPQAQAVLPTNVWGA